MPPHIYVSRIYVSPPPPAQLEAKPIKQNGLYLCTVKVEVSKIKMESQKEYEDKGCPKGIF